MILIVGLGNPGEEYEKTRHNIGSRVINELAKRKRQGVVLAQPQTFMNDSGKAVKALVKFYKVKPENLWVIHDDIDLPLGEIKTAKNRGAAGHKGVESIIKELKTKDFNRLRMGICPKTDKPRDLKKFVLQRFTKEEEGTLKEVVKKAIKIIEEQKS